MPNKKRYILIIFIVFAAIILFRKDKDYDKDLKIFVTNDIHYLSKSLTDTSEEFIKFASPRDGKQLLYINEIFDVFIGDIKNRKPNVLILNGDLTTNGEKESHLDLAKRLKKIEKMGTRVLVTPGNHDTKNMWARGFKDGKQIAVESISKNEFLAIYNNYGYRESISKDENSLSYLAAASDDLWLLMIDSNLYFEGDGMPTNRGYISSETQQWIKDCALLADEKGARIVASMHHNIFKHSERMSDGVVVDNYPEVDKLLRELDIKLVLSGHIHVQSIESNEENSLFDIATSSLSVYPHQYGVISYNTSGELLYNTSELDVEGWAKANNLKDKNLLNFEEYTSGSFYERSYSRAYLSLLESDGYTDEEMHNISDLVAQLNLRYFAGNIYDVREDIINSSIYKMILDTNSDYVYDFVYSMMISGGRDNTYLKIYDY